MYVTDLLKMYIKKFIDEEMIFEINKKNILKMYMKKCYDDKIIFDEFTAFSKNPIFNC